MDGMQQLAALAGAPNIDLRTLAQLFQALGAQNSKGGQDTILAHINPQEYEMLLQQGGSGRTDPMTGLPHFENGGGDHGSPGSGGSAGGGGRGGGDSGGGGAGSGGGGSGSGGGERGGDSPGGDSGGGESEGGGFGRDAGGWRDGGWNRTSTSLSDADMAARGLSGYSFGGVGRSTQDFEPNSLGFGFAGLTPGTVASPEGLLDATHTRDAALGWSPTALGIDVLSAATQLPIGLATRAFGYTPSDYSVIGSVGGMPGIGGMSIGGQPNSGAGNGMGSGGGNANGTAAMDGMAAAGQQPATGAAAAKPSQSILSVLQSLFGADKVYGVRA